MIYIWACIWFKNKLKFSGIILWEKRFFYNVWTLWVRNRVYIMHTSFFIIKLKGKFYESVKFHISNSQSKELKHKFQINICIFISAHRKDTLHKASEHGKKVLIECSFVKWESEEKKSYNFSELVEAVEGVRNKTIIMKLLCKHITARREKGKKAETSKIVIKLWYRVIFILFVIVWVWGFSLY